MPLLRQLEVIRTRSLARLGKTLSIRMTRDVVDRTYGCTTGSGTLSVIPLPSVIV